MKKIPIIRLIFPCLFAAACSAPVPPDAGQLRERFGVEIPAYWHASAFHLEASQLRGDRGDRFLGRFRATIALTAPTYVEDHRVGDTLFIRQAGSRGDFKTVYGRADATRAGREWSTRFQMENDPTRSLGQPRDFFTAARVIVVGSPEDAEFQARQREREAEAQRQAEVAQMAALVGEWRGSVFDLADARLVVSFGEGGNLIAYLYNQGYREVLVVRALPDGRFRLLGIAVAKPNGERGTYYLDTFDVQFAIDGSLTGSAHDASGASGAISMHRIDAE